MLNVLLYCSTTPPYFFENVLFPCNLNNFDEIPLKEQTKQQYGS